MCKNATQTAASVMAAIEPTLKALLSYLETSGLLDPTKGNLAISAFDAALIAVQNWKNGTAAQNVLQLLGDFQAVFSTLPLPTAVVTLTNIILAGVETVIGILIANSPAPAAVIAPKPGEAASPEEARVLYQSHVIADTTAKVQQLVPSFKRSFWHSAASQYKSAWNHAIGSGGFPNSMQI